MLAPRSILVPLSCFTVLATGCSETSPLFQSVGTGGAVSSGTGGDGAPFGSGGKTSGTGGGASGGAASKGSGGAASKGSGGAASKGSGGAASKGSGGSSVGGTSAGGSQGTPSGGTGATGGRGSNLGGTGGTPALETAMTFFVTSDTAATGNLGGLEGADHRCQTLAEAVGRGGVTWHAYLSTETPIVNAIDRISNGPYINSKGVTVAADKAALHARAGDAELFLDENGMKINGQWEGSLKPNQHDIMTGSNADGSVKAGATCGDWASAEGNVSVGHSDGLGPNMDQTPPRNSWNAAHDGDCADPSITGGAGRIYCFVAP